jgi:hypothetical protein
MIQQLLVWMGAPPQPAQLDAVSLFMNGMSIPQISASQGGDIIAAQRRIEQQIRGYVLELEHQISELQQAER